MTSTSSEPVVLRDLPVDAVANADATHDLRDGAWTRFGGARVLGDRVTEATLRGVAERSHQAARAQGFAAGWAEGQRASLTRSSAAAEQQLLELQEGTRRAVARQESAASALAEAARRCDETARALQTELTDRAVDLALEIAAAVLGREVTLAVDPGADAVRRAVAGVPVDVPLVVRLNPEDLAALDQAVLAGRPATLVADPRVSRGDAVVETENGWVDADIAGSLARVREVLGR
jgi:flagellar assembly protein FliH